MAHIVLTSNQSNISKIVFENMALETAKTIADHCGRTTQRRKHLAAHPVA